VPAQLLQELVGARLIGTPFHDLGQREFHKPKLHLRLGFVNPHIPG
jgi:hypothetical protein